MNRLAVVPSLNKSIKAAGIVTLIGWCIGFGGKLMTTPTVEEAKGKLLNLALSADMEIYDIEATQILQTLLLEARIDELAQLWEKRGQLNDWDFGNFFDTRLEQLTTELNKEGGSDGDSK